MGFLGYSSNGGYCVCFEYFCLVFVVGWVVDVGCIYLFVCFFCDRYYELVLWFCVGM